MENPYRKALMERPRTWRNLLAGQLLIWACRISGGHITAIVQATAYDNGWRAAALGEST